MLYETHSGISEREDSRTFGAMIEKRISSNWKNICIELGYEPKEIPRRRTIFDFARLIENTLFGFDIKNNDLDSNKYSVGSVCAIENLLKFLANDKGVFMLVEFGHTKSCIKNNNRNIEYIRMAPFHCLPNDTYRIENSGTGQERLNYTIHQVWDEINWDKTYPNFLMYFAI